MGIICSRQLFCGLSGAQQREGGGGGLNNDVAAVCYRGGAVNGKRWWEEWCPQQEEEQQQDQGRKGKAWATAKLRVQANKVPSANNDMPIYIDALYNETP